MCYITVTLGYSGFSQCRTKTLNICSEMKKGDQYEDVIQICCKIDDGFVYLRNAFVQGALICFRKVQI